MELWLRFLWLFRASETNKNLFSSSQDPCRVVQTIAFYCARSKRRMVKYTNLMLSREKGWNDVMGTDFYGRKKGIFFFYDHLNKKDSRSILVIKHIFGCVSMIILFRVAFKFEIKISSYLENATERYVRGSFLCLCSILADDDELWQQIVEIIILFNVS